MGWWRWRLARVLSLVYCQYYRPHVAISPEFRGRASDQSSDCWAPVSQSSSDQQAQSTPPGQQSQSERKTFIHLSNRNSSGSLKLGKNYIILFLSDYSFISSLKRISQLNFLEVKSFSEAAVDKEVKGVCWCDGRGRASPL